MIIRYPGSKAKLWDQVLSWFPGGMLGELFKGEPIEYREPFFGAGAIGLRLMQKAICRTSPIWINDADPGMWALWTAVNSDAGELCRRVMQFKPTAAKFYEFKERDDNLTGDPVADGFNKLALHRMSMSGFGYMSGGPIGGRNQTSSAYTVGCRWTPSRIVRDIQQTEKLFAQFSNLKITHLDFREVVKDAPKKCFFYLDPPYYEKGSQLYKHSMKHEDHEDLAALLRQCKAEWVLSYDDHETIRKLYSWANFSAVKATYTNAVAKTKTRPKNQEVVITAAEAIERVEGDQSEPPAQHHSATSVAAAEAIKPVMGKQRTRVYEAIRAAPHGLSDEEGCTLTGMNPSSWRPRRGELQRLGMVVDSGERRETISGAEATVWKVA